MIYDIVWYTLHGTSWYIVDGIWYTRLLSGIVVCLLLFLGSHSYFHYINIKPKKHPFFPGVTEQPSIKRKLVRSGSSRGVCSPEPPNTKEASPMPSAVIYPQAKRQAPSNAILRTITRLFSGMFFDLFDFRALIVLLTWSWPCEVCWVCFSYSTLGA